jgi:N-methylhydantoinase A/oxoprolinase/acetone carboxylase beta subunit
VKYARVGGHDTYVNSLDVRVIGIAGGSMVRVSGKDIADVGPRSAHIAGLPYSAFADPADIEDPQLDLFRPKDGDPDDYVAIRTRSGTRYAITNTCAANVLGLVKEGWHARGNAEAARRAMLPLSERLGVPVEEVARCILEKASTKVIPVVESLLIEYKLDRDQAMLVGEGGGGAALIPFVADRMKLAFKISQDAEVISSIGVALALVRESVERVIPNPSPEDLQRIKREAFDAVVKLGAAPENVEVTIEVDAQTQRVRATAMGASEMRAQDLLKDVSEDEARNIAATSMGLAPESLRLVAATDQMRVFQGSVEERKWRFFKSRRSPVRAVDREGVIRIQRSDGVVVGAKAGDGLAELRQLWEQVTIYNGDSIITPDMFVISGRRVVDLSGVTALDQALAIGGSELEGLAPETPVAFISVQGARGI